MSLFKSSFVALGLMVGLSVNVQHAVADDAFNQRLEAVSQRFNEVIQDGITLFEDENPELVGSVARSTQIALRNDGTADAPDITASISLDLTRASWIEREDILVNVLAELKLKTQEIADTQDRLLAEFGLSVGSPDTLALVKVSAERLSQRHELEHLPEELQAIVFWFTASLEACAGMECVRNTFAELKDILGDVVEPGTPAHEFFQKLVVTPYDQAQQSFRIELPDQGLAFPDNFEILGEFFGLGPIAYAAILELADHPTDLNHVAIKSRLLLLDPEGLAKLISCINDPEFLEEIDTWLETAVPGSEEYIDLVSSTAFFFKESVIVVSDGEESDFLLSLVELVFNL